MYCEHVTSMRKVCVQAGQEGNYAHAHYTVTEHYSSIYVERQPTYALIFVVYPLYNSPTYVSVTSDHFRGSINT
jgi:hypothetical protein